MSRRTQYFEGDTRMAGYPGKVNINDDGTFTIIDGYRGIARTFSSLRESLEDNLFGESSEYMRSRAGTAFGMAILFATAIIDFIILTKVFL